MEALLAIDPHKQSMTVAVFDAVSQSVVQRHRFSNSRDGYRAMRAMAKRWSQRRWAVEGSQGAGRSIAQRLVGDGEPVVDVPAKLAARVRVYSEGHGRKTDDHDAESVGLAALNARRLNAVEVDGVLVALRLLADRRSELVAQRTRVVCRLHRLFCELTPGGAKRFLSAKQAGELLAKIRPRDVAGRTRRAIAMEHLADIRSLDRRIARSERELAELVAETQSRLMDHYGVGPVVAAIILGEVGNIARFADRHAFASYNGTAPIEVSSGEITRHRLSRAGNRKINFALHMAAISQIRGRTAGHDYYERKRADGKTHKEAIRCLKRRISDAVYRTLNEDLDQPTRNTTRTE
jgi:transposase